jgi:hypothetical protein
MGLEVAFPDSVFKRFPERVPNRYERRPHHNRSGVEECFLDVRCNNKKAQI